MITLLHTHPLLFLGAFIVIVVLIAAVITLIFPS